MYNNGTRYTYKYNGEGQLHSVISNTGFNFIYDYDSLGRLIGCSQMLLSMKYRSGLFEYDRSNRLSRYDYRLGESTRRTIDREARRANQQYAQKAAASAMSYRNNIYSLAAWESNVRFAAGCGFSSRFTCWYGMQGYFPNAPSWYYQRDRESRG